MNRITGHWIMTNQTEKMANTTQFFSPSGTITNQLTSSNSSTFDGNFLFISNGNIFNNIQPFSCQLNIDKDFKYNLDINHVQTVENESWFWLAQRKKKSGIYLKLPHQLTENRYDYTIDRLTNKELILKIEDNGVIEIQGTNIQTHYSYTYEATFEKE